MASSSQPRLAGFEPVPVSEWEKEPPPWVRSKDSTAVEDVDAHHQLLMESAQRRLRSLISSGHAAEAQRCVEQLIAWGPPQKWVDGDEAKQAALSAIYAVPFTPSLVETIERIGVPVFPGPDASEKIIDQHACSWAKASPDALTYAFVRAKNQVNHAAIERSLVKHLSMHQPIIYPDGTNLEVAWLHAPEMLRARVHNAVVDLNVSHTPHHSQTDTPNVFVLPAVLGGHTNLIDLLINPERLGHPNVIKAWVRAEMGSISSDGVRRLAEEVAVRPAAAAQWASCFPMKGVRSMYGFRYESAQKYLGHPKWLNSDPGIFVKGGLIAHAVLRDNIPLLRDLAQHPSTRAQLSEALMASPPALFLFLHRRQSHGMSAQNLMAWDRQGWRDWRDTNGCCLAHYAAAATVALNLQADPVLMRLMRLEPSWAQVVTKAGVGTTSLLNTTSRARLEKEILKKASGTLVGKKGTKHRM